MNSKDTDEAMYPLDSSDNQADPSQSLYGSVIARSNCTNSPIPLIDFSGVPASRVREVVPMPPHRGIQRGGVADPFPCRLHQMLSQAEHQGWENIVSWQPHGRSFRVHDSTALHEVIMPRFFGKSKVSTFRRQLYLYGFAGLKLGPDKGSFYHMMFLRHRPDLCPLIFRKQYAISAPSEEPNLYTFPVCPKIEFISNHASNEAAASQQPEGPSMPLQLSASDTMHSQVPVVLRPPSAFAPNHMLRYTYPCHDGRFGASGDNDDGRSVKWDRHCTLHPTNIVGQNDKPTLHGPTAEQALPVDQLKPLDRSLSVHSFLAEAIGTRKETNLDSCSSVNCTRKAPAGVDISDEQCSRDVSKTEGHTLPWFHLDSSSSGTARIEDLSFRTASDSWFRSGLEHLPNAPGRNSIHSSKTASLKTTTMDTTGLQHRHTMSGMPSSSPDTASGTWFHTNREYFNHSSDSSTTQASKIPLGNMNTDGLECERTMTEMSSSLHEARRDNIDSNPHPSTEAALFSVLEPEPMTESDLAACRRIAGKKQP